MEQIQAAIETFVKGGDTNNVTLLDTILHPHFQNIQDSFFTEKGIYVFSKQEYIDLVKSKTFGGSARHIHYTSIEQQDGIAIAKVVLESPFLIFESTIICVYVGEAWQVISNIPSIVAK